MCIIQGKPKFIEFNLPRVEIIGRYINKQKLKDYDIDLNQYFMVENLDNCYFYKKYD